MLQFLVLVLGCFLVTRFSKLATHSLNSEVGFFRNVKAANGELKAGEAWKACWQCVVRCIIAAED